MFSRYVDALQVVAHYDDVEIANPLGTKVKKVKNYFGALTLPLASFS